MKILEDTASLGTFALLPQVFSGGGLPYEDEPVEALLEAVKVAFSIPVSIPGCRRLGSPLLVYRGLDADFMPLPAPFLFRYSRRCTNPLLDPTC